MNLSKYVYTTDSGDHKYTLLYNYVNGVSIKYAKCDFSSINLFLKNETINNFLHDQSFFCDSMVDCDSLFQKERSEELRLIILAHQNCNFRCTYCYEKFEKNGMNTQVEANIIQFVENELSQRKIKTLIVSWFGGEPMLGLSSIKNLSEKIIELCKKWQVIYLSDITTNGYNLTEKNLKILKKHKIRTFQVTLDGPQEYHDKQRPSRSGRGTFNKIINNLVTLQKVFEEVICIIRINVGPNNYSIMDKFIDELLTIFGNDDRFLISFENIGSWGEQEVTCLKDKVSIELMKKTLDKGGNVIPISWELSPNRVCYASSPKSFVIGVDGLIYKCTVALYDDLNIIGQLDNHGNLNLDERKYKLWIEDEIPHQKCTDCIAFPSCRKMSCPFNRIKNHDLSCRYSTEDIGELLKILDKQDLIQYRINLN